MHIEKEKKESEQLIDELKAMNDKQNEANKFLEEKIIKLENESKSNTSKPNVVRTDSGDILMLCNECEYPAEDIFDLGEHMFEIHSSRYEGGGEDTFACEICNDKFISDLELIEHGEKHHRDLRDIKCKFCDECFQSKTELMRHNKEQHIETVSTCWNYPLGTCDFGEQACWFRHSEPITSSNMHCKICDKSFPNKQEFHIHRKQQHTALVTPCYQIDICKYGEELCWFSHDEKRQSDIIEAIPNDNKEVLQRIFEIMEKMTERISELEKRNKT